MVARQAQNISGKKCKPVQKLERRQMKNPFEAIERVIINRYIRGTSKQDILEYLDHLTSIWKYHIEEINQIETNFLQSIDNGFVLWYPLDKLKTEQNGEAK
jgi:hypothetical protein